MQDIYTKTAMLAVEHIEDKTTRDNFLNKFAILLNDYTIQPVCTDLVVCDDSDLKAMNMFLGTKAVEGLSKKSLTYYGTILQNLKKGVNKSITELTTNELRAYIAIGLTTKKWSTTTANNVRKVLMSFYGWAYAEKYIPDNPMVRIKAIKGETRVREPLADEEIEKLRLCVKNKRDRAIIEVLLSTGCRISELTGMTRNGIDWQESRIKVLGKGNKERYVYLNATAKLHLKDYLDTRTDADEVLFRSKLAPYTLTNGAIETLLAKLGDKCGIKKVHPHRFRHTVATKALQRGMPITEISKMLGHEDIKTTTIYAKTDLRSVQENHRKYLN